MKNGIIKLNDGGNAFPIPCNSETCDHLHCQGMSLRAWLAGMAMQGFIANPYWAEQYDGTEKGGLESLARACVVNADAILAELEKPAP
jgi:hypothetical protein